MKNKLLVLFITLFIPFVIKAQIGEYKKIISLGVNSGIQMSKVNFDPIVNQKLHLGPEIGATFRITSERYFKAYCSLQVELNYAESGWKEDIYNKNHLKLEDQYQRNLKYLQLPFLTRLGWGRIENGLMGSIVLGPQVSFLIQDTTKKSNYWTLDERGVANRLGGIDAQYAKEIDHKIDYGIVGGLSLDFNSKVGRWSLEGRYYYGLSDIFSNAKKDVFSRSNNSIITIKVSYLFDITNRKSK